VNSVHALIHPHIPTKPIGCIRSLTKLRIDLCWLSILRPVHVSFVHHETVSSASAVLTDIALTRTRRRSRALGAADFALALQLRASNESAGCPTATPIPERAKKLATYLDLVAALRRPPYTASSRSPPPPSSPTLQDGARR
jgi:hypothetical protein